MRTRYTIIFVQVHPILRISTVLSLTTWSSEKEVDGLRFGRVHCNIMNIYVGHKKIFPGVSLVLVDYYVWTILKWPVMVRHSPEWPRMGSRWRLPYHRERLTIKNYHMWYVFVWKRVNNLWSSQRRLLRLVYKFSGLSRLQSSMKRGSVSQSLLRGPFPRPEGHVIRHNL